MILCVCLNPSIDTLIDLENFQLKKVNRVKMQREFPGGKGIHVAMALQEMGEQATVLGIWGKYNAAWLKQKLKEKKIPCTGIEVEGFVRRCYTFQGDENLTNTELLGMGAMVNEADNKNLLKAYSSALESAKVVVISGSTPAGVPDEAYATMISIAKKNNTPVFLDTTGKRLESAMTQRPFCIHVNKDEGVELSGKESSKDILDYLNNYCEWTALTLGAKGLLLRTTSTTVQASCRLEKVLSTVGCGDCLLAGLVYAYLQKMSLLDAAKYGTAAGSANCLRPELGMLYRTDVHQLLERTQASFFEKIK